jgi:methylenetetrahydrofolate reductase (NADPH)
VTIPIIPGVMPLTSLRRLARLGELTGVEPAPELIDRLAAADTDAERIRIGVGATVDLANAALDAGAPGIHLYTFNQHTAVLQVLERVGLVEAAPTAADSSTTPLTALSTLTTSATSQKAGDPA